MSTPSTHPHPHPASPPPPPPPPQLEHLSPPPHTQSRTSRKRRAEDEDGVGIGVGEGEGEGVRVGEGVEYASGSGSGRAGERPATRRRVEVDGRGVDGGGGGEGGEGEGGGQRRGTQAFDASSRLTKEQQHTEPIFIPYPDPTHPPPPNPIPFQQPTQLTSFSYTPAHIQEFTDAALRYFVDPPLGASLRYGYERWVRRPDERGRLDALLRALCKVRREAEGRGGFPEIGVVAWRGIMTKILTAPYENRDGWDLNVMLVNGTLYLEEHLTEERLNEKNNMNERQRSQTYYGYAFESYCTSETPPGQAAAGRTGRAHGEPVGWAGDVDTNVQWCSVVRTKLGDMRMIIGGEVDCVRGKYTGQTDTFVELKTSLAIRGRQDEERFERKLLKFYFQSFLLGVPEIVVGFRTPAGVVTTVQSFKTMQLPRMVRGKPGAWDPMVCMHWGAGLLRQLKVLIDNARGDIVSDTSVWRARFVPGKGVSVAVLEGRELEEVVNGEERVGFLPRWYWDTWREASQGRRTYLASVI